MSEDSFAHFLVVEGNGTIACGGEEVDFEKGDSLFLPAGSGEFQVEGKCEALITTIGEKANPIRIAVDMTSRQIQVGLVDMNHVCFAKKEMEIEREEDYRLTVRNIGTSIIELLEKNDLKVDNCIGIGAGLPGTVDRKAGKVIYSNNIGWENVPFVKELQKYIPLPVYINNNANCIALGEMVRKAGGKYANAVLLTIGNGIGGSIILDGEIFEGRMAGGERTGAYVDPDGRAGLHMRPERMPGNLCLYTGAAERCEGSHEREQRFHPVGTMLRGRGKAYRGYGRICG